MKNVSTINGSEMDACDVKLFRFKEVYLIVVTGQGPNICGHSLLNFGGKDGFYVHVTGIVEKPRIMSESQYQTYLRAYTKQELLREKINLGFPEKSISYLEKLLSEDWNYKLLFHNCSHFVEKILQAGGYSIYIPTHCPIMRGIGVFD
jgi:hypothetical protein